VLGPGGRGAVAAAGLTDHVDVIVGTLGKALGGYGAYVCCNAELARYLTNSARTLIYSTGPPPPSVAAAMAALTILQEQPRRTERLRYNASRLRNALLEEGFYIEGADTQIVPLVIGDSSLAMDVCERALKRGVFAQAIRPPTVPRGTARLRLAAMATHAPAELKWAAQQLAEAAREAGLEPAAEHYAAEEAYEDEPTIGQAA
jgi:glycine C-acetyltransferase/8-amino-7-oxononanoate synthase